MAEEIGLKDLIVKPTDNPAHPKDVGRVKKTPAAEEYAHTINEVIDAKLVDKPKRKSHLNKIAAAEHSDSGLLQAAKTVQEREEKAIDRRTGLESAYLYEDALKHKLERYILGKTDFLTTIKMDLDLFSWMNDALKCTELGNLTLQALGNIVRSHIRASEGDRAFRKGGEEFGILPNDARTLEEVMGIESMTKRLLESVRTRLLKETISLALGHRMIDVEKDGKLIKEREGTGTLKQFAQAIISFQSPGGDGYLMERGKGTIEQRSSLKDRINSIDVTDYRQYLADNQLFGELDEKSQENRKEIEKQIGDDIKTIFQKITVSVGLLCITPEDRHGVTEETWHNIESIVDRLTYDAKDLGGDCLVSKVGSMNESKVIT